MNYASRSDMQRERSRERIERARRQWELENADSLDHNSSNSLSRQAKVPSYEATVLHMVCIVHRIIKTQRVYRLFMGSNTFVLVNI